MMQKMMDCTDSDSPGVVPYAIWIVETVPRSTAASPHSTLPSIEILQGNSSPMLVTE